MTHIIRRHTEAILIGAQTAVTDNPKLIGLNGPTVSTDSSADSCEQP